MPMSAPKPCGAPGGCPALVRSPERFCPKHKAASHKADRDARGSSRERGYSWRWEGARREFLLRFPLCQECLRRGRVTPARVVDHVVPHRGDQRLFWDEANWEALCDYTSPQTNCHGKKTARGA